VESNRGDAQGGFQRSVLKPLLWGEPPAFGGVGGTFPAPALPPQGETGKGESNQNSLLPQAITYWLMPESALSPQPPNSLEPLEARHSQFLKRVKPASLEGTNGCTQSGPPMLTIQAKPTYITYSCSQPEKEAIGICYDESKLKCNCSEEQPMVIDLKIPTPLIIIPVQRKI